MPEQTERTLPDDTAHITDNEMGECMDDCPGCDTPAEQEPLFSSREERLAIALKRMGELVDRRGKELEEVKAELALHVGCRVDISIGDALKLIRGEESNADAPSPVSAATEAHGETTEAQEGACVCEKPIPVYDGPSDPAEDCPQHGNPVVVAHIRNLFGGDR